MKAVCVRPRSLWLAVLAALVAVLLLLPRGATAQSGDPTSPPSSDVYAVSHYNLVDSPVTPVKLPPPPPSKKSTLLWGYEASFGNSRILSYNIAPYAMGPSCIPDAASGGPTGNGRGVTFDPLTGDLWITRLTFFAGDGMIHLVTPPQVTPGTCTTVTSITLHSANGEAVQPDMGALDLDAASKHIWAAGYFPVSINGGPLRNYFYLVNRNNGLIIHSCWIPATSIEPFNDSLTVAELSGLPGSGNYLLTDGGEFVPTDPIQVIDQASCHDGQQATVVTTFPKNRGMTGIDFEWPGLLNTDLFTLYNNGNQPFTSTTPIGSTGAPFGLEGISLCGFRAVFGGDGNDFCPYTAP